MNGKPLSRLFALTVTIFSFGFVALDKADAQCRDKVCASNAYSILQRCVSGCPGNNHNGTINPAYQKQFFACQQGVCYPNYNRAIANCPTGSC